MNEAKMENFEFGEQTPPPLDAEEAVKKIVDNPKDSDLRDDFQKGVEEGKFSFDDLVKIFEKYDNMFVGGIILESLPQLSSERDEALNFLVDLATNYNFDSEDEMGSIYIQDEFQLKIIDAINNFGSEAEDSLLKIMKYNLDSVDEQEAVEERGSFDYEEFTRETSAPKSDEEDFYRVDEDMEGGLTDLDEKEEYDPYYQENQRILSGLTNNGSKESIDFASGFLRDRSFSTYLYKDQLTKVFENIDINYSAEKLLEILKKGDEQTRQRASKILHRLEFGQLGISEQGVKYLEKMYDLGEMNNPDYFAQRLTSQGDVGVFDEERVLQRYFNLGDLTDDKERVRPEIHEVAYETLFFDKGDESEEERKRREKYLQEFKENYYGFYDDEFWQETGIRFNNLNFKEQGWFLVFHKNSSEEKREELMNFARKAGEDGLKSFLSMEFGEESGDKILEIDKKMGASEKRAVFAKLSQLADLAQKKDDELTDILYKEKAERNVGCVKLELLGKAHGIIKEFSSKIGSAEKGENEKEELADLLKKLEQSRIDIDLLSSLLIAAKKEENEEDLNNIKGVEVAEEKKLSEDLEDKMKRMYAGNHAEKSEEEVQRLLDGFDKHNKQSPRYYLLYFDKDNKGEPNKKEENLVGFVRSSSFDGQNELGGNERYLGALNLDPLMHKFYFGESFLRQAVKREFELGADKVTAHVPKGSPSHKSCRLSGFKETDQEGEYKDQEGNVLAPRIKIELEKQDFAEKEE
ncbi:MAG: hypothetical protein R6V40_02145 [Candidatus Moraniibacteriota bacterium]